MNLEFAIALAAALLAAAPAGQSGPISDQILNDSIDLGDEIEGRADGDLNGDGRIDTAYLVTSPDHRTIHVLLAPANGKPPYRPVGTLKLETSSLGPAKLSIAGGVLKIADLTGGTTAMSATYRYRLTGNRMRLIGLDATLYSRTYAHDGYDMSWNLLTGALVTKLLKLAKRGWDAAYDTVYPTTSKRISKPIFMEDTPDPEMVMVDIRRK